MRFDFSDFPFSGKAFSAKPMTFCEPDVTRFLSAIVELAALETGNRKAREQWQSLQIRNLLARAANRSPFWRRRIGVRDGLGGARLSRLPILSRRELREQVASEGSLLKPSDRIPVSDHSTSGSSGVPVRFFVSEMNSNYNVMRSIAQYFLEGRDLTLNRTQLNYARTPQPQSISVERAGSWLGILGPFISGGAAKIVTTRRAEPQSIWRELSRDPIGYLSVAPRAIETLLQHVGPDEFKRAGVAMLIIVAEELDASVRGRFAAVGIPTRNTYSCEEVGLIGAECERHPGRYHVATSNVVVEVDPDDDIRIGEARVGKVLLTHLQSYATPFIRYDVGDLATLEDRCPCGRDGPTLSNVVGRSKTLLKHRDGHLSQFFVRAREMMAIAPFDEFRVRQTAEAKLVVEIGGRESLSAAETAAFIRLMKSHAGDDFDVEVRPVAAIDWGESVKRLGFHNELL
jgi:phenylacetate-coenzyme A ligase PaaK-like adenylate-forming protein